MAHHTEQVGFAPLPLNGGMKMRVRIISPTTGNTITGVTLTEWALYGRDESEPLEPPPTAIEWLEV